MAVRIKDPVLSTLPSLEHYAEQLDFDRITAAILGPAGTGKIAEYEIEDIKMMIWTAAEKWLVRDIYDFEIKAVEREYLVPIELPYGPQPFRGFLDVEGRLRGRLNVSKKHAGKKATIDWKTTHSTLDKTWEERLLDSWQWKLYMYFTGVDVMLYRGFNRKGETRELMIERPAGLDEVVLSQISGVAVEREALIQLGAEVWPRKMPGACGSYGRECPFLGDCRDNSMPRASILPGRSFSYSSMDRFMLCPERYRRGVLQEGAEDTEESSTGQAIHRGLAELYTQVREKFNNVV